MTLNKRGTALITGASTGIGAVYADRLARRGFDLILVARDQARLEKLAATLRLVGAGVDVVTADLATAAGRVKISALLREDERVTMLVNNAGMAVTGTLVDADPDALERMIELNVTAAMRLAHAAASAFVARGHGTIINIASVLALAPERFNGVYDGTKGFVLNLSLSMHQELAAQNIRIQAVLPGATRTEIWQRAGMDLATYPADQLMDAGEMVDAALAGLDMGELVTIPSLPDMADFEAYTAARLALGPNLSLDHAASRYKTLPQAAQ